MSSNKPIIISGEASETDSEDESNLTIITYSKMFLENDASISSAVSALNQSNVEDKQVTQHQYDSLFHQKLKEYNTRLHNDVEGFCQNTINDAGKNLIAIDQQLLRSQLTLQNAVTSLKSLSVNSLTVKNKLHFLLSAKFLPNMKVNK
ncbi:hypothetical protein NQ314_012600 [Rhamnusium bicolor]|uniref:Biogenesis of lysosome-related organelles complex 1 subunit 3 n=1 Tax=Rhamnusium bicolor TaxID=1586634 RepID=A0AAV8XBP0_9CUCU|nr:hypothetical protein NQ314_012600 [Rhamnusium bicolor]